MNSTRIETKGAGDNDGIDSSFCYCHARRAMLMKIIFGTLILKYIASEMM